MKYCSNCGEQVQPDSLFCPSCGKSKNAEIISDSVPQSKSTPNMSHEAQNFSVSANVETPASSGKKRKTWASSLVVIVVLLLVSVLSRFAGREAVNYFTNDRLGPFTTYVSNQDNFSIDFPGTPEFSDTPIEFNGATIGSHIYIVSNNSEAYSFQVNDYSAFETYDASTGLKGAINGAAQIEKGGSVVEIVDIDYRGNPGVEAVVSLPGSNDSTHVTHIKAFVVGKKMYIALVVGKDKSELQRFFSTLKLNTI